MAKNKNAPKSLHTKKQLKKDLEGKMESALPEIKTRLGEKKFHRRIKKAAKLIVQGLHNKDIAGEADKSNNSTESKPGNTKIPKKSKSKKEL